jgi:hypothetical protein
VGRYVAQDGEEADWDEEEPEPDSDESLVPCPYCKRPIYEDAQRCPYCENYISEEDAPPTAKPWWIIIGALLCLYAVYRWIVG